MMNTIKIIFSLIILGCLFFFMTKCNEFEVPVMLDPNKKICYDTIRVEKIVLDNNTIEEVIKQNLQGRKVIIQISEDPNNKRFDTLNIEDAYTRLRDRRIKEYYVITMETIEIIESYYCNQILVNYHDTISPKERMKAQKHLVDTLGLGLVKQCPCSNFEIWGTGMNQSISPEEIEDARRGSIAQNGAGEQFLFNSALNILIPIPAKTDSVFENRKIEIQNLDQGNAPVRIALIDTGVKGFTNSRWVNQAESVGIDNKDDNVPKNCFVDDTYGYDFSNDMGINHDMDTDMNGHGTHIAGIIAGADIADAVPLNFEIMDLKIFENSNADLFDLVCATNYAIDNGAHIINQSLGFYSSYPPEVLYDVLEKARDSNVLVISSAGNEGLNNDVLTNVDDPSITMHHYPSDIDLDNIISVGAISKNDISLLWETSTVGSNYGTAMVDVSARGEEILSTHLSGSAKLSGTSMAAGQITRVAAIIKYQNSIHNYLTIKNCILNYANNNGTIPLSGVKPIGTNFGIIDAILQSPPCN